MLQNEFSELLTSTELTWFYCPNPYDFNNEIKFILNNVVEYVFLPTIGWTDHSSANIFIFEVNSHLRSVILCCSVEYESRCVRRKDLLETLANELPQGAIRYSSKVDSIEESGPLKLVHLADGSTIRTKALIGCDGVNSVVANWLGLQKPVNSGRSAIRGFVEFPEKHGYQPKFHAYFGGGVRFGFLPSDEKSLYWFCTFTPSVVHFDGNAEQDPMKLKQFVLNKASNVSKELSTVVDRTTLDCISIAQLKLRLPWNVLLGNILKNNVCVVGDALHPMTPDLGQGGCSALEDSVVIAKCLGEALIKPITEQEDDESTKIKKGLEKYAKERRWRSFTFISAAYLSGFIQESNNKIISFLREHFLAGVTISVTLRIANFDCGKLAVS